MAKSDRIIYIGAKQLVGIRIEKLDPLAVGYSVTNPQYAIYKYTDGATVVPLTNGTWDPATQAIYFLFDASVPPLNIVGQYRAAIQFIINTETYKILQIIEVKDITQA